MSVVTNEVESYQGDQLVVELRDTGLVQEELRRLGIGSGEIDSSDLLSLTLLQLFDVESAAASLRQDSALVEAATLDRRSRGQVGDGIYDLDLMLFALRRSMRAAHDGWEATVDLNRILGRVQGSPYIKGGVGAPLAVGSLFMPAIPPPYIKGSQGGLLPVAPLSVPAAAPQAGARVAILDTRLYRHPDLEGRYLGESVADFGSPQRSTQGHATFIAGLIAQRAPAAGLVVRQVLDDDGANANSWDVATEMVGILDTGIAVLNLSLGCTTLERRAPQSLTRAVERLIPTVVVVAAAGNNGSPEALAAAGLTASTPHYPAAIDGVVGVGAYDPDDGSAAPASFSPSEPWVSLLAPGVNVQSTFLPGLVQPVRVDAAGHLTEEGPPVDFGQPGYASWSGTSFAAANVTGEIAARMVPGRVSAYDALDQLLNPGSPAGDVVPHFRV